MGLRILIVDDEPMVRRVVELVLEQAGHQVTVADSVAAGRAKLGVCEPFDAVVLDRSMPGGSGLLLIPDLRKHSPEAKVAYLTGQHVPNEEIDLVDAVWLKPMTDTEILAALAALVSQPSQ